MLPTAAESVQEAFLNGTLSACTKARLKAECARIVKQGYAECDQEIDMGVSSVAAPVPIGRIGAAFSVGAFGPVRRLEASDRKKIAEELIRGRR
jgi:DNA-binding IclR family transcriptional regulator